MNHFSACILVLPFTGKGDGENFSMGPRLHQVDSGVFHGHFGAKVAIDPFHGRVGVGHGPLGDQVIDVVGPILDGGVTTTAVFAYHNLNHSGVGESQTSK